jgi:hypothetical protein
VAISSICGRIAVSRRIENCPVSMWRIRVCSGGSSESRKPGWAATDSDRPKELLVSRLDSSSRASAYLVINHMVKNVPLGSRRCTLNTGCSARMRANAGAGLNGSFGSRCARGHNSGSDMAGIGQENTLRKS